MMRLNWIVTAAMASTPLFADTPYPQVTHADVEVISAARVSDQGVAFDVMSTGCTSKNDFEVWVASDKVSDQWRILLIRTKPDLCEGTPHQVSVRFSRQEIGLDAKGVARVANPLGRNNYDQTYHVMMFRGEELRGLSEVDPFEVGDVWPVHGVSLEHRHPQAVLYFGEMQRFEANSAIRADRRYLVRSVNRHYWADGKPSYVVFDEF